MKESYNIKLLKKQNAKEQKRLYENYSPRFLALCKRYLQDQQTAEDALIQGFMKIFKEVEKFVERGSFEAWMHRIIVNECLMEIRKNQNLTLFLHSEPPSIPAAENLLDALYESDLIELINQLPIGCKTVFNLYIIEGFSHKEIAYKLGITEGTSKSQLNLAKTKLKKIITENHNFSKYGR